MDSKEKHSTWIGDIYEKVETFCSGIDNIISQESLQHAETQILTASTNVKQFAGDKFSTTGANVKQFCSDFMQEFFVDFLKDSFIEKTKSEYNEKCDSSDEVLKKENDKCHEEEVSKSDSSDGVSAFGLSTIGILDGSDEILKKENDKCDKEDASKSDSSDGVSASGLSTIGILDISDEILKKENDKCDKEDVSKSDSSDGVSASGLSIIGILDISDEILKKENDKCDKGDVSKSDSSDGVSASGLSTDGNEMILDLNRIKLDLNLIPSETSLVNVLEKNDVGITTSTCRIEESHDGGNEDPTLLQPFYSFTIAERNAEPETSKLDSIWCRNALMLLYESRVLENEDDSTETCSGFVEAEDSLEFSLLDEPDTREMRLNCSEPLDSRMTMHLNSYCGGEDKIEDAWEFMEKVGYKDHPVESDEPQKMKPKKFLKPKEPEYKNDCESSESDWEIV